MISFTIKLLLAFVPTKSKQKNDQITHKTGNPELSYVLRLEKTPSCAHVEYQLLPTNKPYKIDVLCWSRAAKIYTVDGVKIFKTVTKNGMIFVPVCVQHNFKELTKEELMALRDWVVEFQVFPEKSKLANTAKLNKTDVVYIRESDCDKLGFVEGFSENINESATKSTKNGKGDEAVSFSITSSKSDEGGSFMKFDDNFADIMYEIIDYATDDSILRDQVCFKDFVHEEPAKPKKTSPTTTILKMQGEVFFTDNDCVFKAENYRSDVRQLYVIPHVDNLLTRSQKIQLNPIIIKLNSVENFPQQLTRQFSELYCTYSIPDIAQFKSIQKPISTKINFRQSHFYSTCNAPKIKLLEFLGTKRLLVELYGVERYQNPTENPKLYGEKPQDRNIAKIQPKRACSNQTQVRNVLLAYCYFDLSSLLNNVWDFKAKEQLHVTSCKDTYLPQFRNIANPCDHSCQFWSSYDVSMTEINLAGISLNENIASPLKEYVLLEQNTTLSLEAYLLSPQSAALVFHQIPNTFKRLMLIGWNKNLVQQFLGKIISHNQHIMHFDRANNDFLTGFFLDNGNNFIVYVEGHSVGFILNLWRDLNGLKPYEGRVFFNTDQVYENRLYNVCSKWSGFYFITMKIPLQLIVKKPKLYVEGRTPLLCQKALIKLNLMLLSPSIKCMLQHDLFPTMEQLTSLDIEYGVACGWKDSDSSQRRSKDSVK